MIENFHYATMSEAINKLRQQGFVIDFNLEENCISCDGSNKFKAEDFEIVDIYRYEGNSDPADEAVLYAIESRSGLKGILITGYGVSSDTISASMLQKLKIRKKTKTVG